MADGSRKRRVLVVEDEDNIAIALDYLHATGFGEEQLACFEQFDKMIMGRNK